MQQVGIENEGCQVNQQPPLEQYINQWLLPIVFSYVYFVIVTYSCLINHSVKNDQQGHYYDKAYIFIGPESDYWQCLSLTDWLTHSRLVNMIDMTLACEDANSKFVEVVIVADVDDENRVGNSLLEIWKLKFGHKAELWFRL